MENMKKNLLYAALLIVATAFITWKFCNTAIDCKECVPDAYLEKPNTIIPVKQAKEMYENYSYRTALLEVGFANAEQLPWGQDDSPYEDLEPIDSFNYNPTRYIEYSIEEMKHYIAYVENESKKAGVEVQGLRIYLGAYPNSSTFPYSEEKASFPKQESIFINPTAMNGGEAQVYFIRSGEAVFIKGLGDELYEIDGTKSNQHSGEQKGAMFSFSNILDHHEDVSLTMNRGNVIPPPKDEDDYSGGK